MSEIFTEGIKYPFDSGSEKERLSKYSHYDSLAEGRHYEAFAVKAEKGFTDIYSRLRFLTCNFASLVGKVSADGLFGEDFGIRADKNQDWIETLISVNHLRTQCLESAYDNSILGDDVFTMRAEDGELIIESKNPACYFPHIDPINPKKRPEIEEIVWTEKYKEDSYLVREIHSPGLIEIKVHKIDKAGLLGGEYDLNSFNLLSGREEGKELQGVTETNIDRNLVFHIPNSRQQKRYFGTSDLKDIEGLMFALDNRMTKIDNILDKHSDPILAVPEGVLDEEGNVKKSALGMIEVGMNGEGKPEYIVWNANLDSAFKEVDKLIQLLFLFSDTSPDSFNLSEGGGQAESGRALKFRLLRTIAKINRKRRYYDQALKDMLLTAQDFAQANQLTVGGESMPAAPEKVAIIWKDGIVNDPVEEMDIIAKRTETGTISRKTAIMRLDDIPETEAEEEIKRIDKEGNIQTPAGLV